MKETHLVAQDAPNSPRPEAVEAIRSGITAAEEGRVRPARQALRELQEKLGIPD